MLQPVCNCLCIWTDMFPEDKMDFYKQKERNKANILASIPGKMVTEGDVAAFDVDKFLEDVRCDVLSVVIRDHGYRLDVFKARPGANCRFSGEGDKVFFPGCDQRDLFRGGTSFYQVETKRNFFSTKDLIVVVECFLLKLGQTRDICCWKRLTQWFSNGCRLAH